MTRRSSGAYSWTRSIHHPPQKPSQRASGSLSLATFVRHPPCKATSAFVQAATFPRTSTNLRRRYSVAAISRKEPQMTSAESFDQAIEANHRALDQVASGDPSGFFELYSDSEEATLANPFGPPARGRAQIEEAGQRAASNYREGRVVEFESFARVETDEFGYSVEIERFEAKVGGSDEMTPVCAAGHLH